MTDYQKYINALRKCAKEHESDTTFTGHIIVSDLCRDTANLLETIEQEPILDKIKAEIKGWYWQADKQALAKDPCVVDAMVDLFIRTIDKYKAESEDKE